MRCRIDDVEIRLHPHAVARSIERGATIDEVRATVTEGERFQAKHGRQGFRRNFSFDGEWNGRRYTTKQLEVYAVDEEGWRLVITVVVKFF
jgi:hypothetical protein